MENCIKKLRTRLGWSQEELAQRVGTSNQMISLLERGRRRLTVEWLDRLARAFGCMPVDIFRPAARATTVRLPGLADRPRDVPVRGTAAGSASGTFQLRDAECIGFVRRPPGLEPDSDVYAIYVTGNSMEPAHPDGELRFVDPHATPQPGDFVIVLCETYAGAGVQAYIKRLLGRNKDWIEVEQLNPRGRLKLSADTVLGLHRILTLRELFES